MHLRALGFFVHRHSFLISGIIKTYVRNASVMPFEPDKYHDTEIGPAHSAASAAVWLYHRERRLDRSIFNRILITSFEAPF